MYSINDMIKQIHTSNESGYEFKKKDELAESYYLDYSSCSHAESLLIDYDSQNLKIMRNRLQKLWEKDEAVQKYISVVMLAMTQELLVDGEKKTIDLYNYMM